MEKIIIQAILLIHPWLLIQKGLDIAFMRFHVLLSCRSRLNRFSDCTLCCSIFLLAHTSLARIWCLTKWMWRCFLFNPISFYLVVDIILAVLENNTVIFTIQWECTIAQLIDLTIIRDVLQVEISWVYLLRENQTHIVKSFFLPIHFAVIYTLEITNAVLVWIIHSRLWIKIGIQRGREVVRRILPFWEGRGSTWSWKRKEFLRRECVDRMRRRCVHVAFGWMLIVWRRILITVDAAIIFHWDVRIWVMLSLVMTHLRWMIILDRKCCIRNVKMISLSHKLKVIERGETLFLFLEVLFCLNGLCMHLFMFFPVNQIQGQVDIQIIIACVIILWMCGMFARELILVLIIIGRGSVVGV